MTESFVLKIQAAWLVDLGGATENFVTGVPLARYLVSAFLPMKDHGRVTPATIEHENMRPQCAQWAGQAKDRDRKWRL